MVESFGGGGVAGPDGPRRRDAPSFATWRPLTPQQPPPTQQRSDYADLTPEAAAARIAQVLCADTRVRRAEISIRNIEVGLRRILEDFKELGKDLSTLRTEDCARYRAYLGDLADAKTYSPNYCSHLVRKWNAVMHGVFGDASRPGAGLILKSFKQTPSTKQALTESEYARLIDALDQVRFRAPHFRRAFDVYLELARCAGPRIGSLLQGRVTIRDIDWTQGVLHLRHMKNMEDLKKRNPDASDHPVVLTEAAVARLRSWCTYLETLWFYQGPDTPLFLGPAGHPLTPQGFNKTLRQAATIAGITKPVSTHVLRKTTCTLISRQNEKLAYDQLGISDAVGRRHYNRSGLEDRLARRDILPGSVRNPSTNPGTYLPTKPPTDVEARRPKPPEPPGYG